MATDSNFSNLSSSSLLLDFLDDSFAAAHCDAPHSPLPETYTTFIFCLNKRKKTSRPPLKSIS